MKHLFLSRCHVYGNDLGTRTHHVVRALLLEVEHAGEHRPLRLIELAVRVRTHHQRPQLVRRVRRNVVLDNRLHSKRTSHKAGNRVDRYDYRCKDAPEQTHHRYRILSRGLGMLARQGTGYEFAHYYMEQGGQGEPRQPANHTKSDRR